MFNLEVKRQKYEVERNTQISKEIISGRHPMYYVHYLAHPSNPNSKIPLTYTSFFTLPQGKIDIFVNDTTTEEDNEDLATIYFDLLQLSLPTEVLDLEKELFSMPKSVLLKQQNEDIKILRSKKLPFATVAYNLTTVNGIETFDDISLGHVSSLPTTKALQLIQLEAESRLLSREIFPNMNRDIFQ